MIDLDDVRAKIRDLGVYNEVGDALNGADAMENFVGRPPAAFVSTSSERAAPNKMATGFRQRVYQGVSVLFVEGQESAARDTDDRVEARKRELVQLLVAWTPQGAASPFEYVSYSVRFIGGGLVWGEVILAAPYFVTQNG